MMAIGGISDARRMDAIVIAFLIRSTNVQVGQVFQKNPRGPFNSGMPWVTAHAPQ
jgi:hypothetical protein